LVCRRWTGLAVSILITRELLWQLWLENIRPVLMALHARRAPAERRPLCGDDRVKPSVDEPSEQQGNASC